MSLQENAVELGVRRDGGRVLLLAPGVGLFSGALPAGRVLTAGATAGALTVLGTARRLIVPEGVHGRIVSRPPERLRQPVGHGDVLYELDPQGLGDSDAPSENPGDPARTAPGLAPGRRAFRAPSSGRFWRRPSPQEPWFVEEGASITDGQSIGLLEVMKTFTRLTYRAAGGLPARARVARVVAADGADVSEGDVLLELE